MSKPKNLQEQLARDEGEVPYVYKDHLGYYTIGIGFLVDKRKGGGLYPEEMTFIFNNRIRRIKEELSRKLPWLDQIDEVRRNVIYNMAYQMGVAGVLGFKNTLAMLQRKDYEGTAKGMLNSLWARQTPSRANRLSTQMRTGEWQ